MSNSVSSITDTQFEAEVLNMSQPVLAYFWAPWCGPCRLMSPAIDWAATQYGDRLKIVKMEIDPNPETISRYGVQGVPSLLLFHQGQVIEAIEGAVTKQKLEAFLTNHLNPLTPSP
jgi:thioredoxin 1